MKKIFFFIILSFFLVIDSAYAHKVMIFAWQEGDTIYTQSKFSGGKKVNDGKILVYEKNGEKLLEGKTDKQGLFSFKIKKNRPLNIVLEAGIGHKAKWFLDIDDTEKIKKKQLKTIKKIYNLNDTEKLIDKKLRPILLSIEELKEKTMFKDILGGIGYILGLLGLATYFKYRNN